jgi:hypothetical protein
LSQASGRAAKRYRLTDAGAEWDDRLDAARAPRAAAFGMNLVRRAEPDSEFIV